MTLTTRHKKSDPIEKGIAAVADAWRDLLASRWWRTFKAERGIVGYIRSLEFTWTLAGGWHCHAHVLLLCKSDERPTKADVSGAMSAEILERWQAVVVKNGGGKPTRKGFDLQLVDAGGKVLAVYMSKIQEKPAKKGIGAEMGRADYKTGDGKTSWTPFDLLDDTGDESQNSFFGHLFVEYFNGTFRRQIITWSAGLRKLTLGTADKPDEQLAADGAAEEAPRVLLYTFQKTAYDSVQSRPSLLAEIMDHAAYGETDAIAELALPYWHTANERDDSTTYMTSLKAQYSDGQARRAAAEVLNPPRIYSEDDDF
jgi:hypothetical protein